MNDLSADISAPNLEVLLGKEIATLVIRKAGSMIALAQLNGNNLRQIGKDEMQKQSDEFFNRITDGKSNDNPSPNGKGDLDNLRCPFGLGKKLPFLYAGHIVKARVLQDYFDGKDITQDGYGSVNTDVAKAAVAALGQACAAAVKVDLVKESIDGSYSRNIAIPELHRKIEAADKKVRSKVESGDEVLSKPELVGAAKAFVSKRRGGKEMQSRKLKREREDGDEEICEADIRERVEAKYVGTKALGDMGLSEEDLWAHRQERAQEMEKEIQYELKKQAAQKRAKEERMAANGTVFNDTNTAGDTSAFDLVKIRSKYKPNIHKCKYIGGVIDFGKDDEFYASLRSVRI
eukprot:Tbor_TRINITY_DN4242_c0_g1::TRINITY_DN4242_c0_g1_i1::g.23928::m.23928